MTKLNLQEGAVDLFIVYQFLKRLATPFEKWDAYTTGVIDKDGEIIVDKKNRSQEQKQSFEIFDNMIRKMKLLLAKVPGGSSRIASYASALWLIKEDINLVLNKESLLEDEDNYKYLELLESHVENEIRKSVEEDAVAAAPTNSAGSGNVAGIGVGARGEPGVSNKKKKTSKPALCNPTTSIKKEC